MTLKLRAGLGNLPQALVTDSIGGGGAVGLHGKWGLAVVGSDGQMYFFGLPLRNSPKLKR
jgi:hypothetical protein